MTKRLLADHRRELSVAAAFAVLLVALAVRAPDFYRTANLRDVLVNAAPTLVAAVGMTLVIVARQIDISIGSQFAICGVVAGVLAKHAPMPAAALGAIGAGALLGACNGLLVGLARLPAIVVTLATMVGWREALRWSTGGLWVRDLPAGFQWLGMGQDAGRVHRAKAGAERSH